VSASKTTAAILEIDPSRQEAMSLFPREAGFTAWYSDNGGKTFRLVLDRIAYRSDSEEVSISFNGQLEDTAENRVFFRIGFRDAMVLESFPKELALPAEAQKLVTLRYPYEAGKTWTQLIAESKILIGTILSNEVDPLDNRQTIKAQYQMMSRSKDHVYYTAARTYKQGLGMVRMEVRDGASGISTITGLVKTIPEYQFVSAERGKICFIDRSSLKFVSEPNGQQIADVWIRCEFDDAARKRLIDSRYGQEEIVEGFERLSYVKRHVWFNLADPAYRDQSMLPLRMIAQEIYYDSSGEVIYSTYASTTWRGGKWFTLPGFESIVQKILTMKTE